MKLASILSQVFGSFLFFVSSLGGKNEEKNEEKNIFIPQFSRRKEANFCSEMEGIGFLSSDNFVATQMDFVIATLPRERKKEREKERRRKERKKREKDEWKERGKDGGEEIYQIFIISSPLHPLCHSYFLPLFSPPSRTD